MAYPLRHGGQGAWAPPQLWHNSQLSSSATVYMINYCQLPQTTDLLVSEFGSPTYIYKEWTWPISKTNPLFPNPALTLNLTLQEGKIFFSLSSSSYIANCPQPSTYCSKLMFWICNCEVHTCYHLTHYGSSQESLIVIWDGDVTFENRTKLEHLTSSRTVDIPSPKWKPNID